MQFGTPHLIAPLLLLTAVLNVNAQSAASQTAWKQPVRSDSLQSIVDSALRKTLDQFAVSKLRADELAITLVDLRDFDKPLAASHRGDIQIYPASVIKLFYLVAAHQWMEEGRLQDTEELRRAMKDMIVSSGNEPTHYIIDLLTGTTSGPELSDAEMEEWFFKRNAVNRYFASLGYTKVNANRKPWWEGPYGREMQSTRMHKPVHRNWLTTDETARLMSEIVTGRAVSKERSEQMMELLKRDPFREDSTDEQARAFIGKALPKGARLWSKAGWTSQTRHDAAYVVLPGGQQFVLVTFTENHSKELEIIPALAGEIIAGLENR